MIDRMPTVHRKNCMSIPLIFDIFLLRFGDRAGKGLLLTNLSSVNTRLKKGNNGVFMKDVGILVLGHGSSLPYNRELVESLAQLIQRKHSGPVRTAYLNMNGPNIPEGLRSFLDTGVRKIIGLPLFLAH